MNSESPQPEKPLAKNRPFIGVGIMLWKGDCLLLGQRLTSHGKDDWQFPGGNLEVGESVLECAARELSEETGLDMAFAEHAGFSNELFSAGEREYITLYVSAAYLSGEPAIMEPEKCRCWQWFPYNQLPTPLFLPITNFIKQSPDLSVFRVDSESQSGEKNKINQ